MLAHKLRVFLDLNAEKSGKIQLLEIGCKWEWEEV